MIVNANTWVAAGMALVLVVVFVFDLMAKPVNGDYATVSFLVMDTAKRYPVLPFLLGMLAGHLIWPQVGK